MTKLYKSKPLQPTNLPQPNTIHTNPLPIIKEQELPTSLALGQLEKSQLQSKISALKRRRKRKNNSAIESQVNPETQEKPQRKHQTQENLNTKHQNQSQIQIQEKPAAKKRVFLECSICFCSLKEEQLVRFSESCSHFSCSSCLQQQINHQLKNFQLIRCLEQSCSQVLDLSSDIYKVMSQDQKLKYYKILIFQQVSKHPNQRLCPSEGCLGVILMDQIPILCIVCDQQYCVDCLFSKHSGPCDQNGLKFLQDSLQFKRCDKCKMVVEKNQGCNHMTCRCGYQFCYLCAQKWENNHKCKSSLLHLPDIIDLPPTLPASSIIRNPMPNSTNPRLERPANPEPASVVLPSRIREAEVPEQLNVSSSFMMGGQIGASQPRQSLYRSDQQNGEQGQSSSCLKKALLGLLYAFAFPLDLLILLFFGLCLVGLTLLAVHKAVFFSTFVTLGQQLCRRRSCTLSAVAEKIAMILLVPLWVVCTKDQFKNIVLPAVQTYCRKQNFLYFFSKLVLQP